MKILLSILFLLYLQVKFSFGINAIVMKFDWCDREKGQNDTIQVEMLNVTHLGEYVHRSNFRALVGLDVDENTRYRVIIFKNNRKLPITYVGGNGCKALETLIGEVYFDVVREAKMNKGCPIKQGLYTKKGLTIDLKKLRLPVPFKGVVRAQITVEEVPSNRYLGCLEIIGDVK